MAQTEADQIREKHKFLVAELKRRSSINQSLSQDILTILTVNIERNNTKYIILLQMAEGLIAAHKAARRDNDGYTIDLIENALRHVGKRLVNETVLLA